jgi:hypothetical protein
MNRYLASAFLALACACVCGGSSEKFTATMNGAQETPPVNTAATGSATFINNGSSIAYTFTASGLSGDPTAAHIHFAPVGVKGPIVVPLTVAPGPAAGSATGTGSFDNTGVTGGFTVNDVLVTMRNGGAYINIHTAQNPNGEIRGQIGR